MKNIRPFSSANTISVLSTQSTVSYPCPKEGDLVLCGMRELRLEKVIGNGGEGAIYLTSTGEVAKIYYSRECTMFRGEKIRRMLNHRLVYPGICFPKGLICNRQGTFFGYLMDKAEGAPLSGTVLNPVAMRRTFPDWTKDDVVTLCLEILRKIRYLHENNIIMGDINPGNILVKDPKTVYFVDTDSYQIEDLPCPVGTTDFTAPERLKAGKVDYSRFLRTMDDDNFAIAVLLFMLMMNGVHPYTSVGERTREENMLRQSFPYSTKSNGYRFVPRGKWRYFWSNLPYRLKDAFVNTFQANGSCSQPGRRYSVDEWLRIFNEYLRKLQQGKMDDNPYAHEIFPTEFKPWHKEKVHSQTRRPIDRV